MYSLHDPSAGYTSSTAGFWLQSAGLPVDLLLLRTTNSCSSSAMMGMISNDIKQKSGWNASCSGCGPLNAWKSYIEVRIAD